METNPIPHISNVNFRRLDFANPLEVRFIAEIDITIPAQFDSDFKSSEETVSKLIEKFQNFTGEDFFEVATDAKDKIIAFHAIKKVLGTGEKWGGSVYTIWVSPEFRRQGLGSALKKRGEDWAKKSGLDHIFTWIHVRNEESLLLNKQLGYEIVHYKLKKKI